MNIHFVIGTGRCGSSLVHEILACHEQVGFVSNIEDNLPRLPLKGRFNNPLYWVSRGKWTRKGSARFAPSEAFQLISNRVSPVYENSTRDLLASDVTPWLRRGFHRFFEERWLAQGRPCFLHKYTGWPRVGFFSEIFPNAKFVHIVRDGRAVANSWLQMNWWGGYRGPGLWQWGPLPPSLQEEWDASEKSFVVLAGLCWRLLMDSFREASTKLDESRYLEIRYEDFLLSPEQSLREIVAFLGLPWSDRLSRVIMEGRIDSSRSRAFERDLTPEQLGTLEGCMRDALARSGYRA
jgi:hypothetical protein